jgi:integrase
MKRNVGHVFRPLYKDEKAACNIPDCLHRHRDRKNGCSKIKESPTWRIAFDHKGRKYQLSSYSIKRADAVKLLKKKFAELGAGRPVGPDVDKTDFETLATIITDDYKANRRRSLSKLKGKLNNLRRAFSRDLAGDVTADRITAYVATRQEEGAENATINRELAALKRAFRLAHRAGRVATMPHISMLHEDNARTGFFEEDQFRAVLNHLPEHLKPVIITAYYTGWRTASEIVTRKMYHLDLENGWLRLEPGETKNGKGRIFPINDDLPELKAALEEQFARTRTFEKESGQIVPWLFHDRGRPVGNFRRAWLTACKEAGIPGQLRHDFRRTAVRNLERAGVPRSAAMAMTGHLTESIYRRYAIVDEAMLKEASAKLGALHGRMSTRWTQKVFNLDKQQINKAIPPGTAEAEK